MSKIQLGAKPLVFTYTNHRGETGRRTVMPEEIYWGISEYHGLEPQWLMLAWDEDKHEARTFAIRDIHDFHGNKPD